MDKTNLGLLILSGLALVGLIGLIAIDKSVEVIVPILTAILGMLAGKNKDAIVGVFKK